LLFFPIEDNIANSLLQTKLHKISDNAKTFFYFFSFFNLDKLQKSAISLGFCSFFRGFLFLSFVNIYWGQNQP